MNLQIMKLNLMSLIFFILGTTYSFSQGLVYHGRINETICGLLSTDGTQYPSVYRLTDQKDSIFADIGIKKLLENHHEEDIRNVVRKQLDDLLGENVEICVHGSWDYYVGGQGKQYLKMRSYHEGYRQ
jgi:hypothetical protein